MLLQFFFTAAFASIGPYTTAVVYSALKPSLANPPEQRRTLIAFIGCCLVDVVCLCHLVLFLWCCNKSTLRTKLRASGPVQKNEEKRKSNIQKLRISNPVSVIKNPPASSASEKAMVDAKAAILGEKPIREQSASPRSSLLLSVVEDQPDQTQITVREIRINSGATQPTPPLTMTARGSGRASPLSTSFEFEQQYPRLSQEFNRVRVSQGLVPEPPTSPIRASQSMSQHSRPSQRPSGPRSPANSNYTSSASAHSPRQHIPLVQPSLHLHNTNSPTFSSTPLFPSSLRNSVAPTQLPAAAHLSNSTDGAHVSNYSNPLPASVPSIRLVSQNSIPPPDSSDSQPSTPQTSVRNRPRNFSLPPSVSHPISASVTQTSTLAQQSTLQQHNPQFQNPPAPTSNKPRSETAPAPTVRSGFRPSETYRMNQAFPVIGTAISTPDVSRPSSLRSVRVYDSDMRS